MTDRVKSGNETIYYNVDTLHDAIFEKKKVAFKYFEYNLDKEKVLRNNGSDSLHFNIPRNCFRLLPAKLYPKSNR